MKNWFQIGNLLISAIAAAEQFVDAPGAEKKEKAKIMVRTFLEGAEGVAGKDWVNDAAFNAAVDDAIDAVVALLNASGDLKASVNKPAQTTRKA